MIYQTSKANWHGYTLDQKGHEQKGHEQVYEDGMFMYSFVKDNPDFIEWEINARN